MSFKLLLEEKKSENQRVVIELGPGNLKKDSNFIGIDVCEKESVDYIADLSKGLAFIEDNSIDEIHAYHFLEHINNLEFFMSEMYRVLKKDAKIIGTVPHFSNPYFYSDYTHSKFWGLYTLDYFAKNTLFKREIPKYYNNLNFTILEINLIFASPFRIRNILKKIPQKLFNMSRYLQELYEENFIYFIPCYEIYFELKK